MKIKLRPKKVIFGIIVLVFSSLEVMAQVAPYRLSPKWVFGNKAMFDFTGGGAPTQPVRPVGDNIVANEGASTLCAPDRNVMVYDNNVRLGGNNNVPIANFMTSSSSSTQGGVIIPNPANRTTQYFVITGNAESTYTGVEPNDNQQQGVRVYSGAQAGASITNPALVSTLRTNAQLPSENVYVSTDGNYGYQIIAGLGGGGSGSIVLNSWRLNNVGVLGGIQTSTYATDSWNLQFQSSVKVNRCQNKIAIVNANRIAVFNWDRATGLIGTAIKNIDAAAQVGGGSKLYGCEFSANGNYLYATTLGGANLIRVDLTVAGLTTGLSTIAGTAAGSLQIGPNDVIYVANGRDAVDNTLVGTITNANTGGTYNPSGVTLANSSTVRLGMSNIAWLNPQRPTIGAVNNSCGSYTFTPSFLTHFNEVIGYNNAVWDFGDGSATVTNTGAAADDPVTHLYTTTTGNKTITVTLTDATCGHVWVGTLVQNVPCTLPIELLDFKAVSKGTHIELTWQTASEVNNHYFDLERSTDGVNFENIAVINGAGNSSRILSYNYSDYNAKGVTVYYRLRQHDFDGKTALSHVISVSLDQLIRVPVVVAPNPFSSSFVLTKLRAEQATVSVYDIFGRLVEQKNTTDGEASVELGTSLANGSYIVQYLTTTESHTLRVEKK